MYHGNFIKTAPRIRAELLLAMTLFVLLAGAAGARVIRLQLVLLARRRCRLRLRLWRRFPCTSRSYLGLDLGPRPGPDELLRLRLRKLPGRPRRRLGRQLFR